MHLPLSIFFSVYLRTSNDLSMGEFDKCLTYILFSGHFFSFLFFSFYARGMVLFCVLQDSESFCPCFDPK